MLPDSRQSRIVVSRAFTAVTVAILAMLIWFSLRLAAMRIFQVDECGNVVVARILANGQARTTLGAIDLFQIPLALLAKGASRSIDIFVSARFVMVELFWLNILLMTLATGERLRSKGGLIAFAGAATLAPLWDYGFEIRHDNLLLTGILLMWCCIRLRPPSVHAYFITGALSVALQFIAFKAFVYTIPISAALLICPPPGTTTQGWKLAAGWVIGAVLTLGAVRWIYGAWGIWEIFTQGARWLTGVSTSGQHRFAPWLTLARLLGQAPLLLAFCAAGVIALASQFTRRRIVALSWEGTLPEFLLLTIALLALAINPTPYPYNLLLVVPYAYLFAFRYARTLSGEFRLQGALAPLAASLLLFGHLAPFGMATVRHVEFSNGRQEGLMRMAENLTDPVRDPVYDGTGLVPTRRIVDPRAFLHSLTIAALSDGSGPRFRELMASNPPAVVIPSYRTDGLPEKEWNYVDNHYVSLADDFRVLGKVLPPGGGEFEVIHAGRYRISTLEGSDLAGTYPEGMKGLMTPENPGKLSGQLDGIDCTNETVELTVGTHHLNCDSDTQPAIVWVGPRLKRIHRFASGDHQQLFVNWY